MKLLNTILSFLQSVWNYLLERSQERYNAKKEAYDEYKKKTEGKQEAADIQSSIDDIINGL